VALSARLALSVLVSCAACSVLTNLDELGGDAGAQQDATLDAGADASDAAADGDAASGCAAGTTDDVAGVYVSAGTGDDSPGCGTRSNPCKTIQQGISVAQQASGKTTVYVARGAYVESLTLAAGLTVEGGWDVSGQTWSPICDSTTSSAVAIQAVTNVNVTASYSGSATLRNVTLTSKASVGAGETLYGVFATGSATSLTLAQVVVDVGAGGAGTSGVLGALGADATDAGCAPGTGAGGDAGALGTGGVAGAFSSSGYAGGDGTGGGNGGTGHNGTAAGNGACATCDVFTGSCPSTCGFGTAQICATNGKAGCAGSGGGGGAKGTAGGASVAVFVWDAHVTVLGGSFTTSNGGNGGSGGVGGDGGVGSAGVKGTSATCATQLSNPACLSNICTGNFVAGYTLDGGTAGGSGGSGGAGGQGGGGSGGVSFVVVHGGDGGVTLNNGPVLAHGDGGTGGVVGGANGSAADQWP
jgi:hypothetical protein